MFKMELYFALYLHTLMLNFIFLYLWNSCCFDYIWYILLYEFVLTLIIWI